MSVEHIRSYIRSAIRPKQLNILTIGVTHERYESTLSKTNHKFYTYRTSKNWNTDYGKIPENYLILDYIPDYIDFDLVLCHTSDSNLDIGINLSNIFNIPIIRHTHTVPQSSLEREHHQKYANLVTLNTFISDFSKLLWGYPNGKTINHGLDTGFWCEDLKLERKEQALSVVNLWKDRDWACGWNIWNNQVRPYINTKVLGKNPGLSEPEGPDGLRYEYNGSLIFLNTSLNSPIPMSLLEAMACGCCVVSLPTCMIPEIIQNGYNGILCETGEEMVKACKFFFENRSIAIEIGQNAKNTILEKYNLDLFIENWNNIFEEVLNK